MLLLEDDDLNNVSLDHDRKVVVVSHRAAVRNQVAQVLRTSGLEQVEFIESEFTNPKETITISSEDVIGVIVDIELEQDVKSIARHIYSSVPQSAWCCVVGDSDSILLVQKFAEERLPYFNVKYQLDQMIQAILSGSNEVSVIRNSIHIAILGCKGGIGSSTLASRIADFIVKIKKVPLLFAQSYRGSHDLDVLFDKKVSEEITNLRPNFDLVMGDPFKFPKATLSKYNFVLYDHPVFNASNDELARYFDNVETFICAIDRNISSLRVARRFLEECERIKATTGRLIRTFICVIDNSAEDAKQMSESDLEMLLKHPIDSVIPFVPKIATKNVLNISYGKKGEQALNSLSIALLGSVSRKGKLVNQKQTKSFMDVLLGYLK